MNVHDKVAFITGAGSGIGRAIACSLATRGCNLALADMDPTGLQETAALIGNRSVKLSTHLLDVCDRDAIAKLPALLNEAHGRIDILVNNAGIAAGGTFLQVKESVFDRVMEVNFAGPVRITRLLLPYLLQRPEARIVNISSVYGLIAPIEQTAYASSKFALRGFSNALRHELQGSTVGVTVVHPGGIATNIATNATVPDGVTEADIQQRLHLQRKLLRMPPAKAGEIIVRGIEQNRPRLLVGSDARLIAIIERMMPVHYWKLLQLVAKKIK